MGLLSKPIKTLDDLFVHTLQDIYYAEQLHGEQRQTRRVVGYPPHDAVERSRVVVGTEGAVGGHVEVSHGGRPATVTLNRALRQARGRRTGPVQAMPGR